MKAEQTDDQIQTGISNLDWPLVSVISVSYQSAKVAKETLDSILALKYPNLEIIIIDNCSDDGSIQIFQSYGSKINILISEPDAGPYDAMNKGLTYAKGEWVWFMNMGDSVYPDQHLLTKIFSSSIPFGSKIIYGNTEVFTQNICYQKKFSPEINQNRSCGILSLNHQSVLCKRSLFDAFGGFNTSDLKIKSDALWFNTVLNLKGTQMFHYVDLTIARYNEEGMSSVAKNFKQSYLEDVFILRNTGNSKYLTCLRLSYFWQQVRAYMIQFLGSNNILYKFYRKVKYG